jgi:thiol-disulfide isomerase/thioredoxin
MPAPLPALLAAVAVFALAGCGEPRPASAPSPAPAGPVELTPTTAADLDAALAAHKGKVVLVDCWYLACGPCVKKFPHLVDLHKNHSAAGLVCVSVNVFPEELTRKDKVLDFLTKQGASFPNYILKDDANADRWQKDHGVEFTPWLILFDRAGKPVPVPEKATPAEVEELVKTALAAK